MNYFLFLKMSFFINLMVILDQEKIRIIMETEMRNEATNTRY